MWHLLYFRLFFFFPVWWANRKCCWGTQTFSHQLPWIDLYERTHSSGGLDPEKNSFWLRLRELVTSAQPYIWLLEDPRAASAVRRRQTTNVGRSWRAHGNKRRPVDAAWRFGDVSTSGLKPSQVTRALFERLGAENVLPAQTKHLI